MEVSKVSIHSSNMYTKEIDPLATTPKLKPYSR